MIIALCATRNMYTQLQASINMLFTTQKNIEMIYGFIEDDIESKDDKVKFINVSGFKKLTKNEVNNKNQWSYISMARCYFTELLPEVSKVIYLDLDLIVSSSLDDLWNLDLEEYAIAGVIDQNIKSLNLSYVPTLNTYINSGVLVMNLDYIRKNKIDEQMDFLLHKWPMRCPDQDVINITCYDKILFLRPIWNSSVCTQEIENANIYHGIDIKPWDPRSKWFKLWCAYLG